jgi:hypothetical protein
MIGKTSKYFVNFLLKSEKNFMNMNSNRTVDISRVFNREFLV